jgi:hypothetical protein
MPKITPSRLASAAIAPIVAGSIAVLLEQAEVPPAIIAMIVIVMVAVLRVVLSSWTATPEVSGAFEPEVSHSTSEHHHQHEQREQEKHLAAAG